MNEVLICQLPDSNNLLGAHGRWVKCSLNELPENCFFLTHFDQSSAYFFDEIGPIDMEECERLLHFNDGSSSMLSKEEYLKVFHDFQDDFEAKGVQKAILSRIKSVARGEKSLLRVFEDLLDAYGERAFVYLVSSPQFGTWMGATPEVLLSGNEERLNSMSLAGTKRLADDVWTEKEIEEQQLVTDFVRAQILESIPNTFREFPVETIFTGAVYHLRTRFEFSLAQKHWMELLLRLHPTPAVCGLPRENALKLIAQHEPHSRNLYTGLIGKRTSNGLSIYVNLRCMEVTKETYNIYVGGGITPRSLSENEWFETENKAKTLERIISE